MSPEETRYWHDDYLDACNRHDLAAIEPLLQPDVRRAHLPGGSAAWLDGLRDLFTAFPDYQWKRIQAVVEGDRIAVHLRARGTHRGTFLGVPPTGRRVHVAEFAFYRLRAGRVAEYAGTADHAELLRQLTA